MEKFAVNDIRNLVFMGHAGAGKTSLIESILHKNGVTNRLGSVDEKTSILDADDEEKEHGHSVDSGLAFLTYKGKEINIIDTPGYPDFLSSALSALLAAETAVIVIDAHAGIQMNTRRLFKEAKERCMSIVIVVNKIDHKPEDMTSLIEGIQETFGMECRCANVAKNDGSGVIDCIVNDNGEGGFTDIGGAHTDLLETILEADEALMESYLGGEEISKDALKTAFPKALSSQTVIPILFTSAKEETGVDEFLDMVANYCPSPQEGVKLQLVKGEGEDQIVTDIEPDPNDQLIGYVCRISSDPRSHIKYTSIRLASGTIKSDTTLQAGGDRKGMRSGHINKMQGDKIEQIEEACAGDIVTLAKVEGLHIGDTVFVGDEPGTIKKPVMPVPMYSLAIEPKSRGDEAKISGALGELSDADPTFKIDRNSQTHETIVSGLGELHVRVMLSRVQHRRGLEVTTKPPMIPYRETITTATKTIEYTHKKQSGGAGQFARVVIDMEPNETGAGYEFIDKIFGGAIDQPFRPSVDKGCQQAMVEGVLAGFPVVDCKVSLVDGKTHPVDSKDIAFQIAGREAFRKAFMQCNPTLLEPIVDMEVTVPSDKVGDITGDLAGRRGRVQGQDVLPGGMTTIKAQVPLSEVQQYNSQLKSVTGGQGSYTMELSHYEPTPPNVTQQVVAKVKAEREQE